jgi:hypothetical protein
MRKLLLLAALAFGLASPPALAAKITLGPESPFTAVVVCYIMHIDEKPNIGCHEQIWTWWQPGASFYVCVGSSACDPYKGMHYLDRTKSYTITQYYASQSWPDSECPTHPGGDTGPGVWSDDGGHVYSWESGTYIADKFRNDTIASTTQGLGDVNDYHIYNLYPLSSANQSPPCQLRVVEYNP